MVITVKLFAYLREGRFKVQPMEVNDACAVNDVLDLLSITRKEMEMGIIMINGKRANPNSLLTDADTLAIFPPLAGG